MNLDLFLSALRARIGIFVLALIVTVLTAAVVSFVVPKTYKATTSLLVDVKDEQSLSSALRPLILPQERMNYMQTQIDIITSEKVVRKVVRDLKLAESPASQAEFQDRAEKGGAIEDWLVENLLKGLKVETSQSSVIQVTFLSRDARLASILANAFAQAYIDTMLELRVEPMRDAATWFDEQLKSLRANLEGAQARLTDYHRKQGIVSADERLDVEFARLGELSNQVVRAQDQRLDWTTRWQQARDFLGRGGSLDELPEILGNPFIQKLKTDLLLGEAKLQELATQYGPNYPQYQRLLSENQSLRGKIEAEMKKIVDGIEKSTRQSSRREAELRRAMAAQRDQLLEDKVNRNQLAVLTRDVENAQRTYEVALQRFIVSQVEGRASQANVTMLNPAAVPHKPYRPRIALNIALSVVVGTLLGMGIVILMEILDRRVRSREDLDGGLNVPLLAVLNARHSGGGPFLLGRPRGAGRALPSPP